MNGDFPVEAFFFEQNFDLMQRPRNVDDVIADARRGPPADSTKKYNL
jgi:hypothetical protein